MSAVRSGREGGKRERLDPHVWGEVTVPAGGSADIDLVALESPGGTPVVIPVHVHRAAAAGPTVLVTAAVHGDEINGTGTVRQLIQDPGFELAAGTLILVPVVNLLAFERHSRYLPDRRDLNRAFPGNADGSMAKRIAHTVYRELVGRADFAVDLHSAAVRRTNLPNVRADLSRPETLRLAKAFGTEVILDNRGADGSLRRSATDAGCPTILLEAGEALKVEATIVEYSVRGVRNLLIELGMVEGEAVRPPYQITAKKTKWVRAEAGGFLHFHASLGDLVREGQALATNSNLLGTEQNVLYAPDDGLLIGMTTLPAVAPGDAVYHLALVGKNFERLERKVEGQSEESLHDRARSDLSTSVMVADTRPEDLDTSDERD